MEFDIKKIRDICYDIVDTIEITEGKMAAVVTYDKHRESEEVDITLYGRDERVGATQHGFVFDTSAIGCRYFRDGKYTYDVTYDECLEELKEDLKDWGIMINDYFGV